MYVADDQVLEFAPDVVFEISNAPLAPIVVPSATPHELRPLKESIPIEGTPLRISMSTAEISRSGRLLQPK